MTAFAVYTTDRLEHSDTPVAPADSSHDPASALLRVEELDDGRTGWRITGEIDLANRDEWDGLLATSASRPCGTDGLIHLDLAALAFIDLSGTRMLVRAADELHEDSGALLALHHPPYTLRRVAALLLGPIEADGDGCLLLPAGS